MSEKRKQALVTYLAALFGIAFVVVSISLIVQINKNGSANTTSGQRVEALQTQVQDLQAQNAELSAKADELQDTILEIQEGTEYLEGIAYEATYHITDLENQVLAYRWLVAAQTAIFNEDSVSLYEAADNLAKLYTYLNPNDQQSYEMVLEYMNQPQE